MKKRREIKENKKIIPSKAKFYEQEIFLTLYTIPERPLPSSFSGLKFPVASTICLRVKGFPPIFSFVSIPITNELNHNYLKNYSDR